MVLFLAKDWIFALVYYERVTCCIGFTWQGAGKVQSSSTTKVRTEVDFSSFTHLCLIFNVNYIPLKRGILIVTETLYIGSGFISYPSHYLYRMFCLFAVLQAYRVPYLETFHIWIPHTNNDTCTPFLAPLVVNLIIYLCKIFITYSSLNCHSIMRSFQLLVTLFWYTYI